MATIPHVSVSQLNTFSQCQGRWFFRYHPDFLLKTPPNAYLTQGQAVHKAQEVNYLQKIESREDLPVDDVCEACADEFQRRAPDTEWADKDPGQYLDQSVALAKLYHTVVAPDVQPVGVEEPIDVPLCGTNLIGFMDVRQAGDIIRDTKTTGKTPKASIFNDSLQLAGYDYAHRVIHNRPPSQMVLDYLVTTKTPKYDPRSGVKTEEEIQRFLYVANAAISRMNLIYGAWEKNLPVLCEPGFYGCSPEWCGYWDICHQTFRKQIIVPVEWRLKDEEQRQKKLFLAELDLDDE